MKVYLAGPFFNEQQIETIERLETWLCVKHVDFYSPRMEGTLIHISPENRQAAAKLIYEKNILRLAWCTHVIAVIDDRDPGTHIEIGYALASNKRIITYSGQGHGLNVMLQGAVAGHARNLIELGEHLFNDNKHRPAATFSRDVE